MIDILLSDVLQQAIVDRIKRQCLRYKQLEAYANSLYYEPYSNSREKHTVTAAVLSGFAPDRFEMDGIDVVDLNYGLATNRLTQPELISDMVIIQLYSNGANPCKNRIVLERCRQYNGSDRAGKQFLLIRFWVDKKGNLSKIEAHLPDVNGVIIETKLLYKNTIIAMHAIAV